MIRRGVLLAAVALLVVAALSRPTEPERPVATVGHAGVETTTTTAAAPPAPASTTTTAPARARSPVAVTTRSSTVVRSDTGGVSIVNEGSASVSTGGNVVIGPPDATVTNGPATAVGNVSRP